MDSVTNFSFLYSFLYSGLCATGFFLLLVEVFSPLGFSYLTEKSFEYKLLVLLGLHA